MIFAMKLQRVLKCGNKQHRGEELLKTKKGGVLSEKMQRRSKKNCLRL